MPKSLLSLFWFFVALQAFAAYETGTPDQVLRVPHAGGRPQFGAVDLSQTAATINQLPSSRGGLGVNASAATGVAQFSSGTGSVSQTLPFNLAVNLGAAAGVPLTLWGGLSGAAGGIFFENPASSGKINWFLAGQYNHNNCFGITPSTATDGATVSATDSFYTCSSGLTAINGSAPSLLVTGSVSGGTVSNGAANTNSAASSNAQLSVAADTGTGTVTEYSSLTGASSFVKPNGLLMRNTGSNGISIAATNAAGTIDFWPNGGTIEEMLVTSSYTKVGNVGAAATPSQLILGDYANASNRPTLSGNWPSSGWWGIGAGSTSADNVLQIGNTAAAAGSNWAGTQNLILSAPNLRANQVNTAGMAQFDASGNLTSTNAAVARNYLINSNFDFWQRGTTFSTAVYTADRWLPTLSGATVSITRQAFTVGQTAVPNEPTYYLDYNVTGAPSGNTVLAQRIEGVRTLAGKSVTASVWLKAGTSIGMFLNVQQNFGSGGSTAVSIGSQACAVTTAWSKCTLTFVVPSVSGKTIGTSDYLEFDIYGPSSGTYDMQIAQAMLNEGTLAMPWQYASGGTSLGDGQAELAKCQRYYEKSYPITTNPGTITNNGDTISVLGGTIVNGGTWEVTARYEVRKRTAPTITLYSPTSGTSARVLLTSATDVSASTTAISDRSFLPINSSGSTQGSLGSTVEFQWTADAEL